MDSSDDTVVVQLLLHLDRILIPAGQHLPGHALLDIDDLACSRIFSYTAEDGAHAFILRVSSDRVRYEMLLDSLRERIVENLRGQPVDFRLTPDTSLPWAIDKPKLCTTV